MTGRRYTERDLSQWLEATGRTPTPPYVDDLLARTARARQRPAWRFPERWLPMDFYATAPALAGRHPPLRMIALVAFVLLALVVGALVAGVASRRLPPRYGVATNGLLVYAVPEGEAWKATADYTIPRGDIMTVDPATGASSLLVGGPSLDGYPTLSLDGTRVAFVREVPGGQQLYMVDIRGGDPKPLTKDPLPTIRDAEWSPDGASIAFTSVELGRSRLWIAPSDGSGAHIVDFDRDMSVLLPRWRPQDGREILLVGSAAPPPQRRAANPSPGPQSPQDYRTLWGDPDEPVETGIGLFLVRPDGTGLRPITPTDGAAFDYSYVAWTPDGNGIVTQRADAYRLKVRVLTAEGSETRTIEPTSGLETLQPVISPDGSKVAYADMSGIETWQIRVAPIDGSAEAVAVGEPFRGGAAAFRWSPDGRTIVVTHHYSKQTWLLDLDAGGPTRAPWVDPGVPAWQRLAP